jgi:hypothetical protein
MHLIEWFVMTILLVLAILLRWLVFFIHLPIELPPVYGGLRRSYFHPSDLTAACDNACEQGGALMELVGKVLSQLSRADLPSALEWRCPCIAA